MVVGMVHRIGAAMPVRISCLVRLYATRQSAWKGEVSALAVLETVLASGLSLGAAYWFRDLTFIVVASCVAPLLLLVTPRSALRAHLLMMRSASRFGRSMDRLGNAPDWMSGVVAALVSLCLAPFFMLVRATAIVISLWKDRGEPLKRFIDNWFRMTFCTDFAVSPDMFTTPPRAQRVVARVIARDPVILKGGDWSGDEYEHPVLRAGLPIYGLVGLLANKIGVARKSSRIKKEERRKLAQSERENPLGSVDDSVDESDKPIPKWTRFGRLVKTRMVHVILEATLALLVLPLMLVGVLLAILTAFAYRWSIKSTAIVWLPLVFASRSARPSDPDLRKAVDFESRSDWVRIAAVIGLLQVPLFTAKAVMIRQGADFAGWWNSLAVTRFFSFYVQPTLMPKWQIASVLNGVAAILLLLLLRHWDHCLTSGVACREGVARRTLAALKYLRALLTCYTVPCVLYIFAAEVVHWLPPLDDRWFPWQ